MWKKIPTGVLAWLIVMVPFGGWVLYQVMGNNQPFIAEHWGLEIELPYRGDVFEESEYTEGEYVVKNSIGLSYVTIYELEEGDSRIQEYENLNSQEALDNYFSPLEVAYLNQSETGFTAHYEDYFEYGFLSYHNINGHPLVCEFDSPSADSNDLAIAFNVCASMRPAQTSP